MFGSSVLDFSGSRRLPIIRQSEAAECGLACLAMVAGYFGHRTTLSNLRLRYKVSLKGTTLQTLIDVADKLRLSSRPLRLELDSLGKLKTPCILHWGMNHFVVLKKVRGGRCVVHDPAFGERRCSTAEVSVKFTGIALELTPTAAFERREDRRLLRISDMWSNIVGLKSTIVQTLILSLIVQLIVLASPFYMQLVVDEVLTKFDTDLLTVLALGFGMLVLTNEIATALRSFVILYASNMLGFQMVSNLFRHLLRLPMDWYEKRHVGDILSRFASTRPIRDLLTEGLIASLIDGLMAVTTLVLIFVYSPLLGSVVLVATFLYGLLRVVLYKPLRQKNEEMIVSMANEQSSFIETVRGIQSIKIFAREADRQSVWQNKYADVINSSVRVGKLKIGYQSANGILFGLENTVIVYLGAKLVMDASISIGMLFAFMAYKRHFVEKVISLVEQLIEFRLLGLHLERISDIALAPADRLDDSTGTASNFVKASKLGEIRLRNVSFCYADGEPSVIDDVSLAISPGETVSIVGPSGCGKTTLMKLIVGLFEPNSGDVLYRGIPVRKYGISAYRKQIGTVMQNDALLTGSIADNIAFFDTEPDLRRLQLCAERALVHDDILSMPMGYDSLVGDMGCALSAGQRQRVLLARALYREPEILLLDEGTANLDSTTEAGIIRMLADLPVTCVCVAHREQMIMASDRVVLLQAGSLHVLDRDQMFAAHGRRRVNTE